MQNMDMKVQLSTEQYLLRKNRQQQMALKCKEEEMSRPSSTVQADFYVPLPEETQTREVSNCDPG